VTLVEERKMMPGTDVEVVVLKPNILAFPHIPISLQ